MFAYGEINNEIKIPNGSYNIHDISEYLINNVKNCDIQLEADYSTSTCSIFCSEDINFEKSNSIGSLLGFTKAKLCLH